MKKQMTVNDLAVLMIKTMASKEDLKGVKAELKENIRGLTKRVDNLHIQMDDLHIKVNTIDNKMNRVENYKVTQLELIKLLAEKKVIEALEAHKLLTA